MTPTQARAQTAGKLRALAAKAENSHPSMSVHAHLRDAARTLDQGLHDAAQRHLRAAIGTLTPLSLYRHGVLDDEGHQAARQLMDETNRHLLMVQDTADLAERRAMRNTPAVPAGQNGHGQDRQLSNRIDLVGPKGYVHGWKYVGRPGGLNRPSTPRPAFTYEGAPGGFPHIRAILNAAEAIRGLPGLPTAPREEIAANALKNAARFIGMRRLDVARTHLNVALENTEGTSNHDLVKGVAQSLKGVPKGVYPGRLVPRYEGLPSGKGGVPGYAPPAGHFHPEYGTGMPAVAVPGAVMSARRQVAVTASRNATRFARMGRMDVARAHMRVARQYGGTIQTAWESLDSAIELSARTAMLERTPAPYGKPGGPGLYHVAGNKHSDYFEQVVQALMRKRGMTKEQASRIAWGALRKWRRGGGHVHPEVVAAAAKALGEEAAAGAKAKGHASEEPWNKIDLAIELFNPYHAPPGSPAGGQFAAKGGGGGQGKSGGGKAGRKAHLLAQARNDMAQARVLRARLRVMRAAQASAAGKTRKASANKTKAGRAKTKTTAPKKAAKAAARKTARHATSPMAQAVQIARIRNQIIRLVSQARQLRAQAARL